MWYGGLTGIVVVLVCLYSYAVHNRTHYDELDRVLESSAEHVAEELEATTPSGYGAVLNASLLLGTGIRLFDGAGRLTHQSASARSVPPIVPRRVQAERARAPYGPIGALAPSLHRVDPGSGAFSLIADSAGRRWRVYVLPLEGTARTLAAVAPLAYLDASVRGFARLMAVLAVIGALLAFAIGWLLSSRALRPVALLTDTAGTIARSQEFSRRVPVSAARSDELGRLAGTFNEMLASLERAYGAQQRFVSDASHELRAPLTVIQANLELLRHAARLPPDERLRAIEEAHAEAERLARLVAELLALARADAGQTVPRKPVELDRALMDVIGQAHHLAKGHQFQVTSLEPLRVRGDDDRLKQLLLILMDNAIKYTPASGRIVLSLRQDGATAEVTIRDTGIGIPEDALPHVFERFYRADPARSRDPGGSGLGLPIARWIATQHCGTVALTSAPNQGTVATIRLPLDG